MSAPRILLTGAFGNIGRETIPFLAEAGCEVVALDVRTSGNVEVQARLAAGHEIATIWADVSDGARVEEAVRQARPTCIIHLASLIPPGVYADEARSLEINVQGTEHLVRAASALDPRPHLVLASSHTVHGMRNGARDQPLLAADTPRQGCDVYTRGKIACEDMVVASSLPWTILRYGIVFNAEYSRKIEDAPLRLNFLVPLDSRSHAIHPADAGLATARAATVRPEGRILMIGGGERWKQRQRYFISHILEAAGVGMLPEEAYVLPDPDHDESWYYTDWMDTSESEALLAYQHHDPEAYFQSLARSLGWLRSGARLAAPLLRRRMVRLSPFYRGGADRRQPGTTLEERLHRFM